MTKFLIERKFHVGEADMPEVSRRSKRIAIDSYPEITWLHSHVVVDSAGNVKTYCIYEAPTEEIVRAHADELGLHDVEGSTRSRATSHRTTSRWTSAPRAAGGSPNRSASRTMRDHCTATA